MERCKNRWPIFNLRCSIGISLTFLKNIIVIATNITLLLAFSPQVVWVVATLLTINISSAIIDCVVDSCVAHKGFKKTLALCMVRVLITILTLGLLFPGADQLPYVGEWVGKIAESVLHHSATFAMIGSAVNETVAGLWRLSGDPLHDLNNDYRLLPDWQLNKYLNYVLLHLTTTQTGALDEAGSEFFAKNSQAISQLFYQIDDQTSFWMKPEEYEQKISC